MAQACYEVWDKVLGILASQRMGEIAAALTACRVGSLADNQGLAIEVPDQNDCECLFENTNSHEQILSEQLAALTGQSVTVRIRGAPGSSCRGRYRKAERPLVQQIRATFEAEILAFEPMSEAEWDKHLKTSRGISSKSGWLEPHLTYVYNIGSSQLKNTM